MGKSKRQEQPKVVDAREREAYHEAGHAVANALLDLPFLAVSIERKTGTRSLLENGREEQVDIIYTEGVSWPPDRTATANAHIMGGRVDLREAVAAMAGPMAEAHRVGELDDAVREGGQGDTQIITVPCRIALGFGKPLNELKETTIEKHILNGATTEAQDLLGANWPKVVDVAGELLQRGRLTSDEVRDIVRRNQAAASPDGQ